MMWLLRLVGNGVQVIFHAKWLGIRRLQLSPSKRIIKDMNSVTVQRPDQVRSEPLNFLLYIGEGIVNLQ